MLIGLYFICGLLVRSGAPKSSNSQLVGQQFACEVKSQSQNSDKSRRWQ